MVITMQSLTRSTLSLAFAAALSVAGATAATAATAANPQEDRITQSSCEADGGTYSFSKGIRSCETTTTETVDDPTPRYASNAIVDGYYHAAVYHLQTTTTTTTTTSQRGNQTTTSTAAEPVVESRYVNDQCVRLDDPYTPEETHTVVDASFCDEGGLYWADGGGPVRP
jgi:hypothetical protein